MLRKALVIAAGIWYTNIGICKWILVDEAKLPFKKEGFNEEWELLGDVYGNARFLRVSVYRTLGKLYPLFALIWRELQYGKKRRQ